MIESTIVREECLLCLCSSQTPWRQRLRRHARVRAVAAAAACEGLAPPRASRPSPRRFPSSLPAPPRASVRGSCPSPRPSALPTPPPSTASAACRPLASLPSGSASPSQAHRPPVPSLAAFEWAPKATLAASLLAPAAGGGGGGVSKSPFVTLSIAESGDTVAAIGDVPVCVNFVGNNHIVVEQAPAGEDEMEIVSGSPPEEMAESGLLRTRPEGQEKEISQLRKQIKHLEEERLRV
ncbi:early nodulin-20-like isoform X2 [Panicum hallii]|uniref:early nodulin-20-like isoform X2 n=1 Tax=Panicum hallii TaxID=206008 RepID=UPI000DF4DE56|nr:early nodulin-20-like isoform X2 [Panicum hallii]